MAKFARVFNLSNGEQLLCFADFKDDNFFLSMHTEKEDHRFVDEVTYQNPEENVILDILHKMTPQQAEAMHAKMIESPEFEDE